jgi:hypothetical protein
MPVVKGVSLIQQIRDADVNKGWFSPENKRFFHDVAYYGLYGKKTHLPYLVRSTEAWTDMFGQKPRLHYRINPVNSETLDIENLIEEGFATMKDVKEWLEEN